MRSWAAGILVACITAAGCVASRSRVSSSVRAGLQRKIVPMSDYVGKREGRWLSAEERKAFFGKWRGKLKIHEAWKPGNSRIASLDIDRDGAEELILVTNGESGYFAIYKPGGEAMKKLIDEWGWYVTYPQVTDFDRDGSIDFVWQGGRDWTVKLARTTRRGVRMIATGSGGLAVDFGPIRLDWIVDCGSSYGRYAGCEGEGRIQRTVPYRFEWDAKKKAFVLLKRNSGGNAGCVLAAYLNQEAKAVRDRYIDCWNWAVCSLCAELEYEEALELAELIPESPEGGKGKTMPAKDKAALIARVKELSKRYQAGFRLSREPLFRNTAPWFPK